MTIFGIGGCMALMLVGFGLKDSIFAIVDIQYGEIQLYDGTVILNSDAAEADEEEVLSTVEADRDVDGAAEGLLTQISVGSGEEWHDIYLDVPKDVESFSEYNVLQNRVTNEKYYLDDGGAVLTEKMAKELDAQPGDTIMIRDEERGEIRQSSAACMRELYGALSLYDACVL